MTRRIPKATDHQRKEDRKQMHKSLDDILDMREQVERQAKDMSRGYPSSSSGGGVSGGDKSASIVERIVVGGGTDLSADASDWLARWWRWRQDLYVLERTARSVLGDNIDKQRALAQQGERVNVVDICTHCGMPAPQVRRIDGMPYCATTCYHSVRRSA